MKYLKLFGLAAVAAMALMAFLGAGSASATVLCTETPTANGACPPGEDYPAGTVVHAELEETAILETTSGTKLVECTVGTVNGTTTTTGGPTETVHGNISALTWGAVGAGCTKTTDTISTGQIIIHAEENHNGTVTVTSSSVTVNTIFGSCVYGTGAELDIGTLTHSGSGTGGTGNEHATLDVNTEVVKTGGSATCPEKTRWTAHYTVTSPKPLYVATSAE